MENSNKKIIFSQATITQIREVVDVSVINDDNTRFKNWFDFKYSLSETEIDFIKNLKRKNKYLQYYSEYNLQAKFISPLFSKIDFTSETVDNWFGAKLNHEINGYEFTGEPDFMIATGDFIPKNPFFFFQEFKPANSRNLPDFQLLAALITGMVKNNSKIVKGAFNTGQIWKFTLLEKVKKDTYKYFISASFDCLNIEDLKQMYIILKAVKNECCRD